MRRQLPVLILCLSFLFPNILFSNSSLPREKTKGFFKKAAFILKTKNIETRKQQARILSEAYFDFDAFASLTLRDHWGSLSLKQREEFLRLFRFRFYERAVQQFEKLTNQKMGLKIIGLSRKENTAFVQCHFTKNGKEGNFSLVWIHEEGKWRWVDIEISKASLVVNYQGQFNKIIRDHGFSELLRRLKARRI